MPLVVIDVSGRAASNADTSVTLADIEAWEQRHGRIPNQAAVFMKSGWEARIQDAKAFVNADTSGAMHFPGFSAEAAEFLARSRDVAGIGVDTLSLDPGLDTTYAAHKAWLATGKWGVELVANLPSVPALGATVFVGATKVTGATRRPCSADRRMVGGSDVQRLDLRAFDAPHDASPHLATQIQADAYNTSFELTPWVMRLA